ncbi:hypothetical protein [Natrarchaeobius chitinivorans]|uniref:DUF3267 domain-containing protein n=1 Tax=Natrarchaeobius chitinivorans TaxID=1679083 RepID=A0A3N6NFJ6_NATCH|nr:hypothetical protein [Natrarchaeobius chitinivorans]RQG97742.1 hypothetical protein EA473_00545 [Natrarchaeobius chitinivorans]
MIGSNVVGAGFGLVFAVGIGLIAHECLHALILRVARIEYTISYFPGRTNGLLGLLMSCPWASVRPHPTGQESPWILRVSALAPFALAVPVFGLVGFGIVTIDSPLPAALAIGILACSIPSPQDFAVAFYAHRHLEETDDGDAPEQYSRAD